MGLVRSCAAHCEVTDRRHLALVAMSLCMYLLCVMGPLSSTVLIFNGMQHAASHQSLSPGEGRSRRPRTSAPRNTPSGMSTGSTTASPSLDTRDFICSTPLLDAARPMVRSWRSLTCGARGTAAASCPHLKPRPRPLFVHIPKTGGESLEAAFHLGKNHSLARNRPELARNHTALQGSERPIFAFSTIRNPFDRAASWFRFCLNGYFKKELNRNVIPAPENLCQLARSKWVSHEGEVDRLRLAFGEWFRIMVNTTVHDTVEGRRTPRINLRDMQASLYEYLMPSDAADGRQFGSASQPQHRVDRPYRVAVDFLIRFENYEHDVHILMCLLGKEFKLDHENDSSRPTGDLSSAEVAMLHVHYSQYYDHATRRLLEKKYHKDLVHFRYSFVDEGGGDQ